MDDVIERCAKEAEILTDEQKRELTKGLACLFPALEAYRLAQRTIAARIRALKVWRPKWRHKKRGSEYMEVGIAEVQTADLIKEGHMLMIYRAKNGKLWARPNAEFMDGRFEELHDG